MHPARGNIQDFLDKIGRRGYGSRVIRREKESSLKKYFTGTIDRTVLPARRQICVVVRMKMTERVSPSPTMHTGFRTVATGR